MIGIRRSSGMADFHNDYACVEHLVRKRWPNGFVYAHCASGEAGGWKPSRGIRSKKRPSQPTPDVGDRRHRHARHPSAAPDVVHQGGSGGDALEFD